MGFNWTLRNDKMAEREGFEPPIPVKVWLISSQLHSTGLCHLSAFGRRLPSTTYGASRLAVSLINSVHL
jgi:hypothetical protein